MVLGELATAMGVERIELPPLSAEAVRTLAEPHGIDADALHRSTGGNPFYVTEVLSAPAAAIPATVRDAVLARAARLSPPARELLERLAMIPGAADPELIDAADEPLDECLLSGMTRMQGRTVAFRHELARLALEAEVPPRRRAALHREVLERLEARGADPARLAHHAEAAGDAAAVLRHAPGAGEQAARLGAHREAAAQFARALRWAGELPARDRAVLLERRSYECYLTDQMAEAVEAREQALACHRELGDGISEGDDRRWLSRLHWFRGENAEAERFAAEAVEQLEQLPPGPELAMAFSNRAQLAMLASDSAAAADWGGRAIALAESLGEEEIVIHALNNVGSAAYEGGSQDGREALEHSLALAKASGYEEHVARAYCNLTSIAVKVKQHVEAADVIADGVIYCTEHDLDSWTRYILAWRAVGELNAGHYDAAIETATDMLGDPGTAVISRIPALVGMGLAYARRGNARHEAALARALELAGPTGELQRIGQVAAALAEAAWLDGDAERSLAATELAWDLACERREALVHRGARPLAGAGRRDRGPAGVDRGALPARAHRAARGGGRALGRAQLPVRGGGGARRPRRARAARRAGGGPAAAPARAALGDARAPRRPDGARGRGARARRRGPQQRRDRRAAGGLAPHGRPPRLGDPAQAGRADAGPRRGQDGRIRRRRLTTG